MSRLTKYTFWSAWYLCPILFELSLQLIPPAKSTRARFQPEIIWNLKLDGIPKCINQLYIIHTSKEMYGLSLIVIIEWVPMNIATFCREEVCLRNLMGEETNHHTETGKERIRVLAITLKKYLLKMCSDYRAYNWLG